MKKILISTLLFSSFASAAQAAPCVSITASLAKGSESAQVLALQNFLAGKGYLKATPNGYFGPATLVAVKLYQKSAGLPQVGNVGPGTRAALAKESCSASPVKQAAVPTAVQPATASQTAPSTQSAPVSAAAVVVAVPGPKPLLVSIDKGTFFEKGEASWSATIEGTSLSASNTVYFTDTESNKRYTLGSFSASSGKIILPGAFLKQEYICGTYCKEPIKAGRYNVTIANENGESNPLFVQVRGFAISASTGSAGASLKQNAKDARLGSISFGTGVPVYITAITASIKGESLSKDPESIYFKDELTGQKITTFGESLYIGENQSKVIGVYGTLNSTTPGSVTGTVTVTISDFIGKKPVSFTSPTFNTSIFGLDI